MNSTPAAAPVDPSVERFGKPEGGFRLRLYTVIFEADTRAGWWFDVTLIVAILASIAVVLMDSLETTHARHAAALNVLEWFFTGLFTVEYIARLACVQRPMRYATSFFGVIDLLSILPTYIALLFPEAYALLDVRILRLLRIFRVFKLTLYVAEYSALAEALHASRRKITIFISAVLMIVLVMGTVMYVVEGPEHGFTSIPISMYWAIVTMTTVGYGDMTPQTELGKLIASMMMLLGWGVLAVPTGIVTSELTAQRMGRRPTTRTCRVCLTEGLDPEARYCMHCGAALGTYRHD
ncbi:MAG: ion transporter [Paucimonas sp.]|jgi:voltage-gated potassium channel|nr:ion transporter [Paucimonas sp.]